jgi:hypothetical protein
LISSTAPLKKQAIEGDCRCCLATTVKPSV